MSRRSSVPAYTHHRASGQARVRIAGRDVYLGLYGSAESRERYARIIAERAVEPVSDPRFKRPTKPNLLNRRSLTHPSPVISTSSSTSQTIDYQSDGLASMVKSN